MDTRAPAPAYRPGMPHASSTGVFLSPKLHRVLPFTLVYEGGYSDDPHDPGGKTMKGIIQRVYDGYRDRKGLPRQWVKYIRDAEVEEIYQDNYWALIRGDQLPDGVDLVVFDFCVNSGPGRAIMEAQRVLGLRIDGMLGPATLAALERCDPEKFIRAYVEARRAFLHKLSTFWRFGTGWIRRCKAVEQAALGMVGHPVAIDLHPDEYYEISGHQVAIAAAPHEDADEQSEEQGRAFPEDPAPPRTTELGLAGGGTSSLAYAAPGIVQRATLDGTLTFRSLALALLSEPLFWAGMAMLWGSLAAWLWRRRHAA